MAIIIVYIANRPDPLPKYDPPLPSNPHIDHLKRQATIMGLMHLAGNRPKVRI